MSPEAVFGDPWTRRLVRAASARGIQAFVELGPARFHASSRAVLMASHGHPLLQVGSSPRSARHDRNCRRSGVQPHVVARVASFADIGAWRIRRTSTGCPRFADISGEWSCGPRRPIEPTSPRMQTAQIRMVDAARRGPPRSNGRFERRYGETRIDRSADRIAHDPARPGMVTAT